MAIRAEAIQGACRCLKTRYMSLQGAVSRLPEAFHIGMTWELCSQAACGASMSARMRMLARKPKNSETKRRATLFAEVGLPRPGQCPLLASREAIASTALAVILYAGQTARAQAVESPIPPGF